MNIDAHVENRISQLPEADESIQIENEIAPFAGGSIKYSNSVNTFNHPFWHSDPNLCVPVPERMSYLSHSLTNS